MLLDRQACVHRQRKGVHHQLSPTNERRLCVASIRKRYQERYQERYHNARMIIEGGCWRGKCPSTSHACSHRARPCVLAAIEPGLACLQPWSQALRACSHGDERQTLRAKQPSRRETEHQVPNTSCSGCLLGNSKVTSRLPVSCFVCRVSCFVFRLTC
jgi:hypothetical protein